MRNKVYDGIDKLLTDKLKATGEKISDKINSLVSKKVDSIKNLGKEKIKEKMGSFIDNLGGKSKRFPVLKRKLQRGLYCKGKFKKAVF